jgi:hypothetical protein
MKSPTPKWVPLLLILAYVLTRLPFLYTEAVPDGDQSHIALGVLDAFRSGTFFEGVRVYGITFSFGYYALYFALAPLYQANPENLFLLMSGIGSILGLVTLLAYWQILRILWGESAGLAGAVILLFAPGWWELTTFGHPSVHALAAYIVANLILLHAARGPGKLRWRWYVLAIAAYTATLTIRADLLLGALSFPVLLWASGRTVFSSLRIGGILVLVATTVFFVLRKLVLTVPEGQGLESFIERALTVVSPSPRMASRQLAIFLLGTGPLAVLAACLAVTRQFRDRWWQPLVLAALGALPSLIWWLQIFGPYRHFLVVMVFSVVPIAAAVRLFTVRKALLVALTIVLGNQIILSATYRPIIDSYNWSAHLYATSRRWTHQVPLGDWFSNHQAAATSAVARAEESRWLAREAVDSILVVGMASYRAEFAILATGTPYDYDIEATEFPGTGWIRLTTPSRHYVFLEGDPPPVRRVLSETFEQGGYRGYSLYLSPQHRPMAFDYPTGGLPIHPPRR